MLHKWIRQPQETAGTYRFSGRFVATAGIVNLLSEAEIMLLYWEVRYLVEQNDGIDYLVTFQHQETNQKLFFIDQLNDEMKPDHPDEHDYCTLLLAEEY
jgi:hypothetical protein